MSDFAASTHKEEKEMRKKRFKLPKRKPTERYDVPFSLGLNSEQVKRHRSDGWVNTPAKSPSKTIPEIIAGNLFTYFNLVFAALTVLLLIAKSYKSLTFLPVVLCNLLIGIIQEIRAKKELDKLTILNAPKAQVIRDGIEITIPTDQLVLDDVVVFRAGSQISADAILLDGSVNVNESLLTGEPDDIPKEKGDELLSGSFVVSGQCFARLNRVGTDSYTSKLTMEAKISNNAERSEMMRSLNKLVGVMGILIIPIGLGLFIHSYLQGNPFSTSIETMVAAVIGMIPEGLYLLTGIALLVSVIRLSSKKVLVHDMKCIETLARVDVLCVDKTGTITENQMKVSEIITLSPAANDLKERINDFVAAQNAENATMNALKRAFNFPASKNAISTSPFSSACKYCGAQFEDGSYILGAPEFVLHENYNSVKEIVDKYSSKGFRVVLFAGYDGIPDGKELTGEITPLALILFTNPIRKSAPRTFRFFKEQGVEIKVISGDNPKTVSEIAVKAGIEGADKMVDASLLKTDEELHNAALHYNVFGRVTPDQKRTLVRALHAAGKTVGMTGDGVNDVLALKEADCSVAMASGCEAATHVAQLVLMDSNFGRMPSIVAEGRRVVNNIERSASLFLVKNIFSILLALLALGFRFVYPLMPQQVSLISVFTIGIPSFILALQPNHNLIRGKFLPNVMLRALPAGITDFCAVGIFVLIGSVYELPENEIATVCAMLLAVIGFMTLYHTSLPMNKIRWILLIGCIVGYLLVGLLLHDLFLIVLISKKTIIPFVLLSVAAESVLRHGTQICERIEQSLKRKAHRISEAHKMHTEHRTEKKSQK